MDELTQLALAAGEGDRVATTAFVRRTQPEVWRVCARLGDRSVADDLTQEVYLRALPALATLPGRVLSPHLAPADRPHVCADHVRGSTRRRRPVDPARAASPAADRVEAPQTGDVTAAVDSTT